MQPHRNAEEHTAQKKRQATHSQQQDTQNDQRHIVILRKPNQELILADVWCVAGALIDIALGRVADKHPTYVAPPFAIAWCVRVAILV
jgi:hypothetical protein